MVKDPVGIADKIFYVVQSGYLKFPNMFRKKFGLGTGTKISDPFPNPEVSVDEDIRTRKIRLIYEFNIDDLERWQKEHKKEVDQ